MLAIYLSPLYILWNAVQAFWILRWLKACSGVFCTTGMKAVILFVYIVLAASMLIAFLLPPCALQRWAKLIGNYWLGVLLYMTLTIGAALILRFFLCIFMPHSVLFTGRGLVCTGAVCMAVILILSVCGIVNARRIRVTNYRVEVEKDCPGAEEGLRVVLAADLHIGYNIGLAQISDMVEKINAQDADLVVFAGDIFDNEFEAVEKPEEMARILSGIQSTYGTYACYGNHDIQEPILAGFTFSFQEKKESDPRMDQLLADAGIRLLRDEAVLINDAFYVYGRPDYERPGRGIIKRKTPAEITADLDQSKPILVLDHEPRELKELADAGVDLDLCGHTHDGQTFPANLTVRMMWENSCGYLQKGQMHNIVTSGVGVFGPFMRLGTKSEICVIDVTF